MDVGGGARSDDTMSSTVQLAGPRSTGHSLAWSGLAGLGQSRERGVAGPMARPARPGRGQAGGLDQGIEPSRVHAPRAAELRRVRGRARAASRPSPVSPVPQVPGQAGCGSRLLQLPQVVPVPRPAGGGWGRVALVWHWCGTPSSER